jgi:SAM-dependent methyltransferase
MASHGPASVPLARRIENDYSVICCPFCRAADIRKVGPLEYAKKLIFADTLIRLARPPELWKCFRCRSGFTQNAVPEESAAGMYAEKISNRWESPLPFAERRTSVTVDGVGALLQRDLKVLDVGCSAGQFLDFAKARGCQTFGLEYSDAARRQATDNGHTCFREISEIPAKTRFDAVFLFDVIEHVYEVPEFLQQHSAGLAPGGWLVLLSGNIASLPSRILNSKWWYPRYPEHVRFPSPQFLAGLAGFRLCSVKATHAFRVMETGVRERLKTAWKHLPSPGYDGKPPILPDHFLIVLQKAA